MSNLKIGSYVLDLGCAPGSWLQVACKELGPKKNGGVIVGIDIQDINLPNAYIDDRVHIVKADVREVAPDSLMEFAPRGFDVVLSDMMPFTSGNALLDVQRSLELTEAVLDLSTQRIVSPNTKQESIPSHNGVLREGGHLVMKVFEGAGTAEFVKDARQHFQNVFRMRPEAVRKASREFYLICKDLRRVEQ